MQPRLACRVITLAVNRFFEHVGIIATETRNFLPQTLIQPLHQIIVTLIPQSAALRQISLDACTVCLDDVFADRLRFERRKVAMPIDDLLRIRWSTHVECESRERAEFGYAAGSIGGSWARRRAVGVGG